MDTAQFLIVLWMITDISVTQETLGPADITLERIEECENPQQYPYKFEVSMNKINRTHVGYSGCVDLPGDLDEMSAMNLTVSKWGDGGWKPNILNFYQIDICKAFKENVEQPWNVLVIAAGRNDGSCPIPKNKYCVEKVTFSLEGLFPSMLYGKFRLEAVFLWKNSPYACQRAYGNSKPSKVIPIY